MKSSLETVAILGGGPVASTLAILLRRQNRKVILWHAPKPSPLLVGESLVPAIIPILQQLGVENPVREFSHLKPGATFRFDSKNCFSFFFNQLSAKSPSYAYNVPRNHFDECLLNQALESGAKLVKQKALIEAIPGTDAIRLSDRSLADAHPFLNRQPDWIVDAAGRARVIPNLLRLESQRGSRTDTALFAHIDHAHIEHLGHVQTTRLRHGWSWQIPLPGRVSVGLVVDTRILKSQGENNEALYDTLLKTDPELSLITQGASRITPVLPFDNYQLITTRMLGKNWILLGDSAGFVDPVFSSGLLIGMQSATHLAKLFQKGPHVFPQYEIELKHQLTTWRKLIGYYYSGHLFAFFKEGELLKNNWLIKALNPHLTRHLGGIFAGTATQSAYSIRLLDIAMKYGFRSQTPEDFKIH